MWGRMTVVVCFPLVWFPAECRFGCGVVVGTGVEKCSCSADAACVSEGIVC
jgi:hypothetical protein